MTSSRRGMSSTSPSSMSTSSRMSRMSQSSRWRAKMMGRCPSRTNLRLASAPITPIPPVIRTFISAPDDLTARSPPGDGVTDPQRHGVDQHERDAGAPVAAIGPGVVGAALDHDVASLHLHRRTVHVHLDLALEHDDVIDGLGAVHARLVARREVDDGEPRPARRRGRADDARAQILDLFSDRDVGRRAVGGPDQRRDGAKARILGVGRRALHDHLGDVVGVVAGHETANGRILFGHDGYASLRRGFPNLQSSFAPTALTNAPQCAKSSWMSLENWAGVRSTRSKLFTRKNSRDCGNSKTLPTSA